MLESYRKQAAVLEFVSRVFARECAALDQGKFEPIGPLLPIKEEVRTWNAVKFSGFNHWSNPTNPKEVWVAQIYGQRSDGQFCYVAIMIGRDDELWIAGSPEVAIADKFRKALEKFQSMRDCSCGIVGYRETGELDEDGYPIEVAVANECPKHPKGGREGEARVFRG